MTHYFVYQLKSAFKWEDHMVKVGEIDTKITDPGELVWFAKKLYGEGDQGILVTEKEMKEEPKPNKSVPIVFPED